MTNEELLAKIKAEIERRMKEIPKNEEDERFRAIYGNEAFVLTQLLSFLDTLESEKPMNQKGLEREIERCLWKLSDDPSNEELRMFARHFAKWQKEQMMKEAVEGVIDDCGTPARLRLEMPGGSFRIGDKVRLIVLPKEGRL